MKRMLDHVLHMWKGKYVSFEDNSGHELSGILDNMEWKIPGDIYKNPDAKMLIVVYMIPKYEEDKETYMLVDGIFKETFDLETLRIREYDEQGNFK